MDIEYHRRTQVLAVLVGRVHERWSRLESHSRVRVKRRTLSVTLIFFFLNDTPPPEISTLPLHDALPISRARYRSEKTRRPLAVASPPPQFPDAMTLRRLSSLLLGALLLPACADTNALLPEPQEVLL